MPNKQTTFSQRMKQARDDAGLSLMDAAFGLRQMNWPETLWVSIPTIQRLENSKDEDRSVRTDLLLISALAGVYGVGVSALSPKAADELDRLRDLLNRLSRCRDNTPSQTAVPAA